MLTEFSVVLVLWMYQFEVDDGNERKNLLPCGRILNFLNSSLCEALPFVNAIILLIFFWM